METICKHVKITEHKYRRTCVIKLKQQAGSQIDTSAPELTVRKLSTAVSVPVDKQTNTQVYIIKSLTP